MVTSNHRVAHIRVALEVSAMRVRGVDASKYVPAVAGRRSTRLGGMRSAASFIDWSGVYCESTRETKRRVIQQTRTVLDYVQCMVCDARIALHHGPGITHIAGVALCSKCADL